MNNNIHEFRMNHTCFAGKLFIHSLVCLATCPQPVPKRVLHRVRFSAFSFHFISLRSCISCLHPVPRPSFYLSSNNVFQKIVSTQNVTNPVSLLSYCCMHDIPLLLDSVIFLYFSHDLSNYSSPSFSSTTFRNSPANSELLSDLFKFRYHTKLYSKCCTLLVPSLNLSPIC
jgi:hypothetical protein